MAFLWSYWSIFSTFTKGSFDGYPCFREQKFCFGFWLASLIISDRLTYSADVYTSKWLAPWPRRNDISGPGNTTISEILNLLILLDGHATNVIVVNCQHNYNLQRSLASAGMMIASPIRKSHILTFIDLTGAGLPR